MKKKSFYYLFIMLMIAVVSAGFVSCSNDDDKGDGPDVGDNSGNDGSGGNGDTYTGIVGTWQLVYAEDHHNDGEVVYRSDEDFDVQTYIHFNADGTCKLYQHIGTDKWDTYSYTYEFDGNTLVFDNANFEVLSFTESEIMYKSYYSNNSSYSIVTYKRVDDSVLPDGGSSGGNIGVITGSLVGGVWQFVSAETHYDDGKVEYSDPVSGRTEGYMRFEENGTVFLYSYSYDTKEWNITSNQYTFEGENIYFGENKNAALMVITLTESELIFTGKFDHEYTITTYKRVDESVLDDAPSVGDDKDDGDVSSDIASGIIGTWLLNGVGIYYNDGTPILELPGNGNDYFDSYYRFYANGTIVVYSYEINTGEWAIDDRGKYSVNGNALKLIEVKDGKEVESVAEIVSFTTSEMVIKYFNSESYLINKYKKVSDSVVPDIK